jgi:hypothetical protein
VSRVSSWAGAAKVLVAARPRKIRVRERNMLEYLRGIFGEY